MIFKDGNGKGYSTRNGDGDGSSNWGGFLGGNGYGDGFIFIEGYGYGDGNNYGFNGDGGGHKAEQYYTTMTITPDTRAPLLSLTYQSVMMRLGMQS
jgi:hypothetical protein